MPIRTVDDVPREKDGYVLATKIIILLLREAPDADMHGLQPQLPDLLMAQAWESGVFVYWSRRSRWASRCRTDAMPKVRRAAAISGR